MRFRFPPLRPASDELLYLDLVRFIASAGIVFHHSHEFFYETTKRGAIISRTSGLALLVDLFFLISGYVIGHVYRARVGSPREVARFMQRRFGRLVPLHWLTLLITIFIWAISEQFGHSNHLPEFTPSCIANNALLLHSFIACGRFQFNGVTWSVSAEVVMYALFPIIALVGLRFKSLPLLAGALGTTTIFYLTFYTDTVGTHIWTEISPILRALPSFLVGVGFSFQARTFFIKIPAPKVMFLLSIINLFLSILTGQPQQLSLLLIYFVFFTALANDFRSDASWFVRILAPLGQLTYSIYMWHSLFIFIVLNIIADKALHARGVKIALLTALCYMSLFIWSYVSFVFFETPARRWIDGLFMGRSDIHGVAREPMQLVQKP